MNDTVVLTRVTDENGRVRFMFYCPGCNTHHGPVTKMGKHGCLVWTFNGDMVRPTFKPSLMVNRDTPTQCHSHITDGKILFLADCKHKLAGTVVDMEPWDKEPEDESVRTNIHRISYQGEYYYKSADIERLLCNCAETARIKGSHLVASAIDAIVGDLDNMKRDSGDGEETGE